MENFYLSAVVSEMMPEVLGRTVSKTLLLGSELLIDLRLSEDRILRISLDPASPALYITRRNRKPKQAESQAGHPFAAMLRNKLGGAKLVGLSKDRSDRVVRFEFEKFDLSGEKKGGSLVVALTGRSSNAYLTDASRQVESRWAERGFEVGARIEISTESFNPSALLNSLKEQMTKDEIVEAFFGRSSIFGPALEKEFLLRADESPPAVAFKSLVRDIFEVSPKPLVYSRVPLEEVGTVLVNPKADLLLSHFELVQARGMMGYEFASLSEAAEEFYRARQRAIALQSEFGQLKRLLLGEVKKSDSLLKALRKDRAQYGEPDQLKRYGDLLLANLARAQINGPVARVIDYYQEEQPEIEIEIGEGKTLRQAASDYFSRYQKARRAEAAISARETAVSARLQSLKQLLHELEVDPTAHRVAEVSSRAASVLGRRQSESAKQGAGKKVSSKNRKEMGRWFRATDGLEIVVGKNDRDNDLLTFRLARPQDIWLHAADYPGSHVIVRNPTRKAVPQRAIKEAAEIAAFHSQAKRESKVAVHYTEKKFVTKPPRSKPGLVRLSSFKTILVEPRCDLPRID